MATRRGADRFSRRPSTSSSATPRDPRSHRPRGTERRKQLKHPRHELRRNPNGERIRRARIPLPSVEIEAVTTPLRSSTVPLQTRPSIDADGTVVRYKSYWAVLLHRRRTACAPATDTSQGSIPRPATHPNFAARFSSPLRKAVVLPPASAARRGWIPARLRRKDSVPQNKVFLARRRS